MTFGEAGLLFGEPRTATVISETDGLLMCLSEADLCDLRDKHPHTAFALMKCFVFSQSEKLRLTNAQVALLDAL
jgi:CRP-like cAMP-binding protein